MADRDQEFMVNYETTQKIGPDLEPSRGSIAGKNPLEVSRPPMADRSKEFMVNYETTQKISIDTEPSKGSHARSNPLEVDRIKFPGMSKDNFFVGGKASTQQIGIDTERTGEVDRGLSSVGDFFHGSAGIPNFIEGGDQDPSSMGTPDYLNLCGRDVEYMDRQSDFIVSTKTTGGAEQEWKNWSAGDLGELGQMRDFGGGDNIRSLADDYGHDENERQERFMTGSVSSNNSTPYSSPGRPAKGELEIVGDPISMHVHRDLERLDVSTDWKPIKKSDGLKPLPSARAAEPYVDPSRLDVSISCRAVIKPVVNTRLHSQKSKRGSLQGPLTSTLHTEPYVDPAKMAATISCRGSSKQAGSPGKRSPGRKSKKPLLIASHAGMDGVKGKGKDDLVFDAFVPIECFRALAEQLAKAKEDLYAGQRALRSITEGKDEKTRTQYGGLLEWSPHRACSKLAENSDTPDASDSEASEVPEAPESPRRSKVRRQDYRRLCQRYDTVVDMKLQVEQALKNCEDLDDDVTPNEEMDAWTLMNDLPVLPAPTPMLDWMSKVKNNLDVRPDLHAPPVHNNTPLTPSSTPLPASFTQAPDPIICPIYQDEPAVAPTRAEAPAPQKKVNKKTSPRKGKAQAASNAVAARPSAEKPATRLGLESSPLPTSQPVAPSHAGGGSEPQATAASPVLSPAGLFVGTPVLDPTVPTEYAEGQPYVWEEEHPNKFARVEGRRIELLNLDIGSNQQLVNEWIALLKARTTLRAPSPEPISPVPEAAADADAHGKAADAQESISEDTPFKPSDEKASATGTKVMSTVNTTIRRSLAAAFASKKDSTKTGAIKVGNEVEKGEPTPEQASEYKLPQEDLEGPSAVKKSMAQKSMDTWGDTWGMTVKAMKAPIVMTVSATNSTKRSLASASKKWKSAMGSFKFSKKKDTAATKATKPAVPVETDEAFPEDPAFAPETTRAKQVRDPRQASPPKTAKTTSPKTTSSKTASSKTTPSKTTRSNRKGVSPTKDGGKDEQEFVNCTRLVRIRCPCNLKLDGLTVIGTDKNNQSAAMGVGDKIVAVDGVFVSTAKDVHRLISKQGGMRTLKVMTSDFDFDDV